MRSLKWKLVLIYVALVFVVMIISGTFIIMQVTSMEIDGIEEQMAQHTEYIYDQIIIGNSPSDFSDILNQITRSRGFNTDIQSSILSESGVTIATNAYHGEALPAFNNAAVISAIAGAEKFDRGKWVDAAGYMQEWINYAKPYEYNGTKYIVYVQTDIGAITDKTEATIYIITAASLLALSFTIIVGILFANTITKPITTLAKKAKEMARGKLDITVDVKSQDEIGQLTKNFNFMSIELHNTMSAISNEKNKLETLLHTMTDGVLAFNRNGMIIHANAASKTMLAKSVYELSDIKNIFGFSEEMEEGMQRGESIKATKVINKKFINACFAPYTDVAGRAGGFVVVLQDLTEQKTLDDMRKEFVANVSHEIRTPLTTIKSYAETLIGGAINDEDIAHEFLTTIDSEADRMALLVTDLLQLSSIDNNKFKMNLENIDLCYVVENNIKHCKILAHSKNQKFVLNGADKKIIVSIDEGRATQVLTNIISNAVKYSPEGSKIEITISVIRAYAAVTIKDNGIGIPEVDLPRIFERFYRVDKARSRSMGGTGLGLAIAKEIMEAMNGFINAESSIGNGTQMTLFFPIEQDLKTLEP